MNTIDTKAIEDKLAQHERIALHVSGGRDSLATFHLLRPYLDKMTVYCVNTDDAFPEIIEVIESMKALAPNFVEIHGRQQEIIAQHGIPSDIVPANSSLIGFIAKKSPYLIQDRYTCCWHTLMNPMRVRMIEDKITLIIRGQKNADETRAPIQSGDVQEGIEYLFPIEHWSHQDVNDYLTETGIGVPRFYQTLSKARDCMTCTGWWEDGRAAYLKQYYPEHYLIYRERLEIIQEQTAQHIADFNHEISQ